MSRTMRVAADSDRGNRAHGWISICSLAQPKDYPDVGYNPAQRGAFARVLTACAALETQ
ncbi:MAG TPA: hypothetical protein VMG35_01800 [Bryobacteraceae bacterium]|nr:hypothetical protein [Bryobacteraceae bacterium]